MSRVFGQEIRKNVNQRSPRHLAGGAKKHEAGAVVKPSKNTQETVDQRALRAFRQKTGNQNATMRDLRSSPQAGQLSTARRQAGKVQYPMANTSTGYSCDVVGDDSHLQSIPYVARIMDHIFDTESEALPRVDYLQTVQSNIANPKDRIVMKMRTILLNWISEVHQKFRLRREVFFLTANLLDRYLSVAAITRDQLQLVGCTAMWIACKYHEIYSPSIRDFTYISDKAFTRQKMIACEEKMVKALNFKLTVPNSLTFMQRFNKVATGVLGTHSTRVNHLSNYLLERSLLDYKMLAYKPSLLSASCLYTAIVLTTGKEWHHELERATRCTTDDMAICVADVRTYVVVNDPKLAAKHRSVVHKYSKEKYGMVAKLRPRRR